MGDLYERRQVTARREHTCHLCGQTVPAGIRYVREKWFYDGFDEVKRHIHCDALLDEYLKSDYYNGCEWDDDGVWEWIRDRCLDLCGNDMREDCTKNPFSCVRMVASITNVNSRKAAEDSLRDSVI